MQAQFLFLHVDLQGSGWVVQVDKLCLFIGKAAPNNMQMICKMTYPFSSTTQPLMVIALPAGSASDGGRLVAREYRSLRLLLMQPDRLSGDGRGEPCLRLPLSSARPRLCSDVARGVLVRRSRHVCCGATATLQRSSHRPGAVAAVERHSTLVLGLRASRPGTGYGASAPPSPGGTRGETALAGVRRGARRPPGTPRVRWLSPP